MVPSVKSKPRTQAIPGVQVSKNAASTAAAGLPGLPTPSLYGDSAGLGNVQLIRHRNSARGGAQRGQARADVVGAARVGDVLQHLLVGGHRLVLAAGQLERARVVDQRVLVGEAAGVELLDERAVGLGGLGEVTLGLEGARDAAARERADHPARP